MRWYRRPWVIALAVVFYPLGVLLMWIYAPWRRYIKWGVTALAAVFTVGVMFSGGSTPKLVPSTPATGIFASPTPSMATATPTGTPIPVAATAMPAPTGTPIPVAATAIPAPTATVAASPTPVFAVEIVSVTSPVNRNAFATLIARTAPGARTTIDVFYSTQRSGAEGLESKDADAQGNVSWTWKVGGNTTPGKFRILVKASFAGRTANAETWFEVQ